MESLTLSGFENLISHGVTFVVNALLLRISKGLVNSFKHFHLYATYLITNIVPQGLQCLGPVIVKKGLKVLHREKLQGLSLAIYTGHGTSIL